MLVAGCQTKEMLRARVQKAFQVFRSLHTDIKIVFSGRNPSTKGRRRKFKTLNEAKEMERQFFSFVSASSDKMAAYSTFKVGIEETSKSTETNIEKFLTGGFLSRTDGNHLYIVSSSFHLPRLAKALDSYLVKNMATMPEKIEKVILIGAEDILSINEIVRIPSYVKQMFFDVFLFLMSEECK